jgi:hypothetical protein
MECCSKGRTEEDVDDHGFPELGWIQNILFYKLKPQTYLHKWTIQDPVGDYVCHVSYDDFSDVLESPPAILWKQKKYWWCDHCNICSCKHVRYVMTLFLKE